MIKQKLLGDRMGGILLIDKPKGITSRDVVDKVVKKFGTKKVGHTGTLDPIATGVLVICVGKATKLVNYLTSTEKEYIATVELGTKTDTLDNTGNILEERESKYSKEQIIEVLDSFKGKYEQEVPIYSAVKVNGKKLYEYARNNEEVVLPKREVEIKDIVLLNDVKYEKDKTIFKFKCTVSKGTYIRALINDIATRLNTVGIMTDLRRTKQGKFSIQDCINIDSVELDSLIGIIDILDCKKVELTNDIEKKVLNGNKLKNIYNVNEVLFVNKNKAIALYEGEKELKLSIMFKEE